MNLKMKAFVLLCVMAVGALILHIYLNSIRIYDIEVVPFWFMAVGVMVCSSSLLGLYKISKESKGMIPYLLAGIYLLSLSLMLMPTSRYNVINGSDIRGEFSLAKETFSRGHLPIEFVDIHRGYVTCLSVTAFPAILSEVSCLSIEAIFKLIYPFLEALIPIFLFISVKKIFKSVEIASLSSIMYAVNHWYIFLQTSIMREQIALIFLLLTLYLMFSKQTTKFCFLILLFSFGIIFSHYFCADLTAFMFLAFLAVSVFMRPFLKMGSNQSKASVSSKVISGRFFLWYIIMVLSWYLFVNYFLFWQFTNISESVISSMLGLLKEKPFYMVEYVWASPRGLIITTWFDLQFGLIVVGFFYSFFKVHTDVNKLCYILGGFAILVYIAVSLVIPTLTKYTPPDRLIGFGYIFFATFLAILLMHLNKSSGSKYLLKTRYFVVPFLFLSLSMNMLLPASEGLLLYHPENSITPAEATLQTPTHAWDYEFAEWISKYISFNQRISADTMGAEICYIANHPSSEVRYPKFENNKYLLIPRYYCIHQIWVNHDQRGQRLWKPAENITIHQLHEHINVVHDNGYFVLVRSTVKSPPE